MKNIILVDLQYPYGKPNPFLSGSVVSVAAVLQDMGHDVEIIDFNIDREDDALVVEKLQSADLIGVSLVGAPDVPGAISFAQRMTGLTDAPVLMGGQVIKGLLPEQFGQIFRGTNAQQIRFLKDIAPHLGCSPDDITNPFKVSYRPVYERMGSDRLVIYLQREMALVVSQGCKYKCKCCAAPNKMKELHREKSVFEEDLQFLAEQAKVFGLTEISFYCSSLDAPQNPKVFTEKLRAVARVIKSTSIKINLRFLSCPNSFLDSFDEVPEMDRLLKEAGVWTIGFGADGTSPENWEQQEKFQNSAEIIKASFAKCSKLGIRPENLMVMGFPEESIWQLIKTVFITLWCNIRWPSLMTRPYLAKPFIPDNKGWTEYGDLVSIVVNNPNRFYDLDFCAVASKTSHPRRWHRWASNAAYLAIIVLLTPFGRQMTSPLMPQGSKGLYGRIARRVNQWMPFDR
tara:strand:- start:12 stop:1379 length:1368 start_codon:yes stop_codon:yes gene_type:complete